MPKFVISLLMTLSFLALTLPASAQSSDPQRLLNEASTYFKTNNYFMGVDNVKRACEALKDNPSALPNTNYISVATKTVNDVNIRLQNAQARNDIQSISQLAYAVQPLLNSLCVWDSRNPRWHYEKGLIFRALSSTMKDQYPVHLESAIKEFKDALATSGSGRYADCAKEMLNRTQNILLRRKKEIRVYQDTHPLHNLNNQPRPSAVDNAICVNCGREYPAGFRCPFCGQ